MPKVRTAYWLIAVPEKKLVHFPFTHFHVRAKRFLSRLMMKSNGNRCIDASVFLVYLTHLHDYLSPVRLTWSAEEHSGS
jgi:hypothetical protein